MIDRITVKNYGSSPNSVGESKRTLGSGIGFVREDRAKE